ncbi:hypothetical protein M1432_00155 [Patescibacteria group bacterium]|nr:hypothetical protein [Patescibacteria group bacterium]
MKNDGMNNAGHPEGCRCMLCQGGKCEVCGEKHCPYHGFGHGCGYGYGFGYRRFILIRVVVAILIAIGIFWIGLRIGSFMGFGGYGPGYGMHYYGERGGYYPMMGYGYWGNASSSNQ